LDGWKELIGSRGNLALKFVEGIPIRGSIKDVTEGGDLGKLDDVLIEENNPGKLDAGDEIEKE
jgi:hypothetical protein